MAEYTSGEKTILYADKEVFDVLSDLRKLDLLKDKLPADKFKDFSYDQDSCSVNVNPLGKIRFLIVEREPNTKIKFEAQQLPFKLNLLIQLNRVADNDTRMTLVANADLSPFLKPMVSKPLQEGLEKIAEMLKSIPYGELNNK